MVTFWAKFEHKQRSRIRENIRIDVNQFYRHVKQVLTPSERIHKFTTEDVIADTISR